MDTQLFANRHAQHGRGAAVAATAIAAVAILVLSVSPSTVCSQEQAAAVEQDTTRGTIHTVQKGDTLWDLSARYLLSPWVWPRVYESNQDIIENPHLIYPGQRIWFPVGGGPPIVLSFEEVWPGPETERAEISRRARAIAGQQQPPETTTTELPEVVSSEAGLRVASGITFSERKAYPIASESAVLAAGHIAEPREWPPGEILQGERSTLTLSLYSQVFLSIGEDLAEVGDLLLVVEVGDRVHHPEWGHFLGRKIHVKGVIQVVDVTERTSQGELIGVFDSVHRGDRVIPAPMVDSRPWREFVPVQGGREGFVVARAKEPGNLHPYDMIFIDGGTEEGVQVGDLYAISRPERERGRLRFFEEELARAVVIAVQLNTATAMIIELSAADIQAGESVRMVGRSVFETPGPGGR